MKIETRDRKRVRRWRQRQPLSATDMAGKLGICKSYYSFWENGEREFGLVPLNKLATLTGINLEYFIDLKRARASG